MIALELHGEALTALPDRALWWPRARTLIVADVHLGKGAAFRRAGVAVPSGSTAESLARLETLIAATGAERLLVLGDLFHTAPSTDEPTLATFEGFRDRHAALQIVVPRGNHDREFARWPAVWRLDWCEDWVEGPFAFAHEPRADARGYVLAGHLHPVLRLRAANDSLRLPVFWFGRDIGVLPSFGAFTGGWPVRPQAGDRLIAVTPQGLVSIPASAASENASCMSSSPEAPASSAPR